MKKIRIRLITCLCLSAMLLSLAGCGGAAGKMDGGGDEVRVQGPDGEEAVVGKSEWPDSELAKKIPEFTQGTVTASVVQDTTISVFVEKVKAEDFDAYLEEVKKTFTEDVYESEVNKTITFGGSDKDQTSVAISFISTDETLNIIVTKK